MIEVCADPDILGITIFDITDLRDIHYCFVDFHGMESEREVTLMMPLSARVYLGAYYDLDAGFQTLLESYEGIQLITASALAETWPEGEWFEPDSGEDEGVKGVGSIEPKNDNEVDPTLEVSDLVVEAIAGMTLREKSMNALLDNLLLQSRDDPVLLAEVEQLTDFVPKLRTKLYEQAATLKSSPMLVRLLGKALLGVVQVDLGPFKILTAEDISAVIQGISSSMEVLNLSNMPELTDLDLGVILQCTNDQSEQAEARNPAGHLPLADQIKEPANQEWGTDNCLVTSKKAPGNKATKLKAIILLEDPKISLGFVYTHLGGYEI